MDRKVTYKDSGVDIEAQDKAAELFADSVKETYSDQVITGLSDFGDGATGTFITCVLPNPPQEAVDRGEAIAESASFS